MDIFFLFFAHVSIWPPPPTTHPPFQQLATPIHIFTAVILEWSLLKIEGPLPVLVLFPAAALKELKVKGSLLIAAGEGSLLRILDRPSDFALLKRIL